MIEIKELTCQINGRTILNNINTHFAPGELTAVIGLNGSGKSTLARHINALIPTQSGSVTVDGTDTSDKRKLGIIRRTVGMVFQDPDAQSVAPIVEDDIAFGPENMDLTRDEIEERIAFALAETDAEHLRHRLFSTLSGGEKQRVAIASVLAVKPKYIIFDEATSMLDPISRQKIIRLAKSLRDNHKMGIIWITHRPEEAAECDRIVLMHNGEIAGTGTPPEIFYNKSLIQRCSVRLPESIRLVQALEKHGYDIGTPICVEDTARAIVRLLRGGQDE